MISEVIGAWVWSSMKVPATELAILAAKKGVTKGADASVKRVTTAWQKLGWDTAENNYRQKLLSLIKTTKVLGNPTPIEIEKIYTDVYVFDKLSAIRRYTESLDEDEVNVSQNLDNRERFDAKSLLAGGKNTFILGRPGAGKTTFLKYLAMSACKGLLSKTPIFVPLKEWSDSSLTLIEFISRQFDICGFPDAHIFLQALLKKGGALVLLDGLDEVNEWQEKRNEVIRGIVAFSSKFDKNQYCLTCRTAATDYSFEKFDYVEVADFTTEQQEQFASQWYGDESMLKKFLNAWNSPRNAGFRDLGKTPLLLTLLCLAFDESHIFPARQVDLYQEAVNALLKKWDKSRQFDRDPFYKDLSYGQRQQLLETIAKDFYFNSRTVFRKEEIAKICEQFITSLPGVEGTSAVDGIDIVRQIEAQHGLIVERAVGLFTFSHLTLQEYFTASYISRNQNQNILRQVIRSGLADQKWHEVMLYTVALLPEADSVLDEMRSQLNAMKMANSGALIFIGYCFCIGRLGRSYNTGWVGQYSILDVKNKIENYIAQLRRPALTTSELTKFGEHVKVLDDFIRPHAAKPQYENSFVTVSECVKFLQQDPLDSGRLLGGYFIDPDKFMSFFYAARMFMECVEVAITSKRADYVAKVFEFSESDFSKIESLIHGH